MLCLEFLKIDMIWDPNGFFYYQFLKSDKCKHDDCTLLLVIKKKSAISTVWILKSATLKNKIFVHITGMY